MIKTEQQHIDLCKKLIEQRFSFGNGQGPTQKDLEVLSEHILEKTGVSISLSTLKRLWKNRYKQKPQLATLNALAVLLDYLDWQDFKRANSKQRIPIGPILKWTVPAILLTIILVLVFGSSFSFEQQQGKYRPPEITGPVKFEASKTVIKGIPNTVIFTYDVSNVVADSFYIQQSWNPDTKIAIDPKGSALTSIYYESGHHRARLMANDSVIAERPVHVLSDDWEPHIYSGKAGRPIDFSDEAFIANGRLHLDSHLLTKRNIDRTKKFYSRISNSRVFDVHSDNFSLYSRIKVDGVRDVLCPWMAVIIVTEENVFSVALQDKGCEKYAGYKLGEISKGGNDNDLSLLGRDVRDWQDLEVRVRDKNASIHLNGELVYNEVFKEDLGKIVGLVYTFDGTGSIDLVRLMDGDGQSVFEDNFER
ncbi:hypothetical protein [Ulvibacterium marinum]|uniref:hypothetical protein n=1 Tax=Ulvibacterium marinum TaxID=2419782 RepID=UPI002494E0C0|nr:hypothetical protein [Ulvibacterium marinum]